MSPIAKELLRKLIHLAQLPIIFGYTIIAHYFSHQVGVLALTGLLLVFLEIEYFRIDYQTTIGNRITKMFSFLLRRHEHNNITGAIFFVITCIIAFSAFDYSIAVVALLLTVFGDFAAAIVGKSVGRRKIFRNKTYAGTGASLLVNLAVGMIVIPELPIVYVSMAFVATMVETLTQKLDDNLTVPLFAGFVGQLIVFFWHLSPPNVFFL